MSQAHPSNGGHFLDTLNSHCYAAMVDSRAGLDRAPKLEELAHVYPFATMGTGIYMVTVLPMYNVGTLFLHFL